MNVIDISTILDRSFGEGVCLIAKMNEVKARDRAIPGRVVLLRMIEAHITERDRNKSSGLRSLVLLIKAIKANGKKSNRWLGIGFIS